MIKLKSWLPLSIVGAVLLVMLFSVKTQAWTAFKAGDSANVAAGQTLNSSLWSAGRNIDIAGTVNGDVFCAGQNINISGEIKGDLICSGQTMNISGKITGDIRVGAQTVNLNGSVGGNATIAAQTVNADSKSSIGGDASFAVANMNLDGSIGRDLAAAGTVNLGGHVGRDIDIKTDQLTLTSNAVVGGSIKYTSSDDINKQSGASVAGTITKQEPTKGKNHIPSLLFWGAFAFFLAIMMILSALIITALLPQMVHKVSDQGIKSPWMSLLTGFVASIAVPIFFILLLVTVVGIPVAILLLLTWLLINLSSGLFSAYWLGREIWRTQNNPIWIILLGSIVLLLLYMIPIIGILALVLATWLGEGMIIRALYARTPKPKYSLK